MSIDTRIIDAITPTVSVIKPNIYKGTALEYCVYTYYEIPSVHADSKPHALRYVVQIHYYLPNGDNPNAKKASIANSLLNAGFTYPSIVNASDMEGQHYVFECQATEGKIYG